MKTAFQITTRDWLSFLQRLSVDNTVYLPVKTNDHLDYKLYTDNTSGVVYNVAKPVTPLKTFFIPVKENVVIEKKKYNKRIIIGIPACDLKAVEILDEIYLNETYYDGSYKENRERSILVGTDCYETAEHCHCTAYGVKPYPVNNADASLVAVNGDIMVTIHTPKGQEILDGIKESFTIREPAPEILELVERKRKEVEERLHEKNRLLPDYSRTGRLITESGEEIWAKYAKTCVSCGACATSCPTCTCFLLIDRPDFEKVRQVDACQYPGFERIAAGEDPLRKKFIRFRNRYLCKYVWKPESFHSIACTGCGRCIDGCIGNINKNKIFIEMNPLS